MRFGQRQGLAPPRRPIGGHPFTSSAAMKCALAPDPEGRGFHAALVLHRIRWITGAREPATTDTVVCRTTLVATPPTVFGLADDWPPAGTAPRLRQQLSSTINLVSVPLPAAAAAAVEMQERLTGHA